MNESLWFDLGYDLLKQKWYESTDLFDICLLLLEEMEEKKIELVYGRGLGKSIPQHYLVFKTDFKPLQYEMYLETMEEHRNSFSKTRCHFHVGKNSIFEMESQHQLIIVRSLLVLAIL